MYRRQLSMAKGAAEIQSPGVRSQFVHRVANLPVVHSAWGYATTTYTNLKESYRLVNYTLTTAEKSLYFVAEHAKPVVQKFEKQIQVVDDLACKGLGRLEEKAPFITKPPAEILEDLYASTVSPGLEKYAGLKNYGTEKVMTVADRATAILPKSYTGMLTSSVDGALSLTERYLDHYLPPVSEEGCAPEEEKKGEHVVQRVSRLTCKVRQRVYKKTVVRLHQLQQDSVAKIQFTVDLVHYARDNLDSTNQKVAETLHKMWAELNAEDEDGVAKNLQEQILAVARNVTRELVQAYHTSKAKNGDSGELDDTSGVMHIVRNVILELGRVPVIVVQELPAIVSRSASRTAENLTTITRRYVEIARVLPVIVASATTEMISDTVQKMRSRVIAAAGVPSDLMHEFLPRRQKQEKPTANDVSPVQNAVDGPSTSHALCDEREDNRT